MLDKLILRRPFFYDWANDDNVVYFSMCYYNALCRADLSNDEVEIIATFPDIPYEKGNEYFGIYKFGDYLLLGPIRNREDFFVYDILNSKFSKISNLEENSFYSIRIFERDSCLYIISAKSAEVNKIDLQDFSVKHMACKQFTIDNAQVVEVVRVEDLIYIPLNEKRKLLIFSMEKEEFKYCEFPSNITFIATIIYYNNRFWLTGKTKKVYAWNIDETMAQEVVDFPEDIRLFFPRNIWFANSFVYNDCLWLFPAFADSIIKYDILTGKLEKFELIGEEESLDLKQIEEELQTRRRFPAKYGVVKKVENRVFFLSSKTRIFYELDLLTDRVSIHDFKMINTFNGQIYPPGEMAEINIGVDGLIRSLIKSGTNIEMKKKKMSGKAIYDDVNIQS